ncbi:hypothetical protein [Pandoraea sp. PE-S2R-1]|uniref:hypothetical protein n=1 Tax=Pandoraea sp. PE-S2R-1 TaxID=1986994 RepID=UPI001130913F|nr:hypothetical protein [Pandoraea sp. PE-S2R-1]
MSLHDAVPAGRYFIHPLPEQRVDDGWYGNKFGIGKGSGGSVVVAKWYPADMYYPSEGLAVESALRRGKHWVDRHS